MLHHNNVQSQGHTTFVSKSGDQVGEAALLSVEQPALLPGGPLSCQVPVPTKGFLRIVLEVCRNRNFDVDQEVAPPPSLEPRNALLANPVNRLRLGPWRHFKRLSTAFEQRDPNLGPERGFSESDGRSVVKIVANSLEPIIRPHTDLNVHVSGRGATLSGAALAVETQACARVHTPGNLDGEISLTSNSALPVALSAWVTDSLPRSRALGALRNRHHRAQQGLTRRLDPSMPITT